MKRNTSGVA